MTTKLIGMREFRQNMAVYTKVIQKKKIRMIVLNKNIPVLEILPINAKDFVIDRLKKDIAEARNDVKKGRVHSLDKISKELGI